MKYAVGTRILHGDYDGIIISNIDNMYTIKWRSKGEIMGLIGSSWLISYSEESLQYIIDAMPEYEIVVPFKIDEELFKL